MPWFVVFHHDIVAIVLPPGDVVCHKPGAEVLSIDPIEEVTCFYGAVTYARELKKVKEQFDKCQKCVIVKYEYCTKCNL